MSKDDTLRVTQFATPASLRATDLSGRHTLMLGHLMPDGKIRCFWDGYRAFRYFTPTQEPTDGPE